MNRCLQIPAHLALAASLASASLSSVATGALILTTITAPMAAQAQGIQREAPRDVQLAKMSVGLPPEITINGQPDRLSPGSRIRDLNNMLVLSGGLSGKTVPVVYRRDSAGLVHEVWLLSPQEYEKLSGVAGSGSGGNGVQQFIDMLALIFGARR